MKKYFLCLFLILTFAVLTASEVKAQGTYQCTWSETFGCRVNSIEACETNFQTDPNQCSIHKFEPECEPGVLLQCIPQDSPKQGDSYTCDGGEGTTINTAIGCIPLNNTSEFIAFFLKWGIGIGGGVAFILIIYSGFIIMTSTGNPDRLKGGKDLLTSAIAGLIMMIFSIFILRFIGVDILQIPGLGS